MMASQYPFIEIGKNTLNVLRQFCQERQLNRFILVTDQDIYPVWGEKVENVLIELGSDVKTIVLEGDPVTPDERYIINILIDVDDQPATFLAVGSGTITDMVRFIAHRTKSTFISLPSAPSMDGYASSGSSLTLNGMKQTVISRPPIAILADMTTLSQAPREMIAAGFGDVFGKFSALADWAMGGLIINDRYSPSIAARVSKRLMQCTRLIDDLDNNWEQNIHALIDALLDVGLCMLETGNSRPASGSEHSCSHYWEMKLMSQGRPVSLHGTKVGFASTLIAERFAWVRRMNLCEVKERLANTPMPVLEDEINTIRGIYGPIADDVISTQKQFLEMTPEEYEVVQQRIIDHWPEIQKIAESVPPPSKVNQLLEKAGLPTKADEIGLTDEDVHEALYYGHYLRNPFTVIKLLRMIGVDVVRGI
jgi:glycerol-1-phosphate dehydrogenase [NAD(P)+]